MDVRIIKHSVIYTRKSKAIVFGEDYNYIRDESTEIGQYESIDEAVLTVQARMIVDICNLQKTHSNYGIEVFGKYEQEFASEDKDTVYVNGFDYQFESNSPSGYDSETITYLVHVCQWD